MAKEINEVTRIHPDLKRDLIRMKAEMEIARNKEVDMPELTKEIVRCPSWSKIKEEIRPKRGLFPDLRAQMNIGQLFFVVAMGFIFILVIGVVMYFVHQLPTSFLPIAQNMIIDGENNASVQAYNDTLGQINEGYAPMAWIPIGILMAMIATILISAFVARNHPVIIVPYVFFVVVVVIFSAILSNSYNNISQNAAIGSELSGFWGVGWFFSYLPFVMTAVGLLGGLIIILNLNRGGTEFYG